MLKLRRLVISLEELAESEGKAKQEIEYTFFARVENFDWLNAELLKEQQEQAEIHVDKGEKGFGQIRVRAVNDRDYELCLKFKTPGELGKKEAETRVTQDMFELMLLMAPHSLRKKRYCYPIEGTDYQWEVDVFENAEGKPYDWIKIDLEVKIEDKDMEIPPLPIPTVETIMSQSSQRTPEEYKKVGELFEEWAIKR